MTTIPTSPNLATRADLETRLLTALMERDAVIYRERMAARDSIVSKSQVRRTNPTYLSERSTLPSLSPFEEPCSLGRL